MKRFVLLIILICLVIDDNNFIIAKPANATMCKDNSKDIIHELESMLDVGVKKWKQPKNGTCSINNSIYVTTKNVLLFVKENSTFKTEEKFHGESVSLNAIRFSNSLRVPRPMAYGHIKNKTSFIALEYLNMTAFKNTSSAKLGSQLADMHLENIEGELPTTKRFGFHVETYVGSIPQNNTWNNDWLTFIMENRFMYQLRIMNTSYFERSYPVVFSYYWDDLKTKIPSFFNGITVKPSLLHGNLKNENIGLLGSKPVIFNPSSFFGHHEYDIAIMTYKGNFSNEFFEAYHQKIPKAEGYEKRYKLYYMIYLLNEWNQGLSKGLELFDIIDELTDEYYLKK